MDAGKGWVSVLARWMRNPDLRVQVTAAKALANMDSDDQYLNEFETKVYPLYPLQRVRRKHQLDVIFIHGLLGKQPLVLCSNIQKFN